MCMCFPGFAGASCEPLSSNCMRDCSGHGACLDGFCHCTLPYSGIDCAHHPTAPIRCSARPCVYVYDLPARLNSLGSNHNSQWRHRSMGETQRKAPWLFLEGLLDSGHRTTVAAEADYFYVPFHDWHGCWGPNAPIYRAHRYISTVYPFYNASRGSDHLWFLQRDAGSCSTLWGSVRDELSLGTVLQHWGGTTGLFGKVEKRCYRRGQDLVVPSAMNPDRITKSPFWPVLEPRAPPPARTTTLFFSGALCWPTWTKARDLGALEKKCATSFTGRPKSDYRPPVKRYSFGHRYSLWQRFRDRRGYRFLPSDYLPAVNRSLSLDDEILRAQYCLAPSGAGWGMRAVHALVLGCVPVVVQHDGAHDPVAQAFEHDLLDWDDFAVLVRHDELPQLDRVLERTDLRAKQAGLRRVWTRMVWRRWLPQKRRGELPGTDAFETIMQLLAARVTPLTEARREAHLVPRRP